MNDLIDLIMFKLECLGIPVNSYIDTLFEYIDPFIVIVIVFGLVVIICA